MRIEHTWARNSLQSLRMEMWESLEKANIRGLSRSQLFLRASNLFLPTCRARYTLSTHGRQTYSPTHAVDILTQSTLRRCVAGFSALQHTWRPSNSVARWSVFTTNSISFTFPTAPQIWFTFSLILFSLIHPNAYKKSSPTSPRRYTFPRLSTCSWIPYEAKVPLKMCWNVIFWHWYSCKVHGQIYKCKWIQFFQKNQHPNRNYMKISSRFSIFRLYRIQ